MEYLYFYPLRSVRVIKEELAVFEAMGYDTDNVQLGRSWHDFLSEVPDHSTLVVYSVDFFSFADGALEHLGRTARAWDCAQIIARAVVVF